MQIIAAAVFADGKRWENYLSELDMIEVDTEYPVRDWSSVPMRTYDKLWLTVKGDRPDGGDPFVMIDGDSTVINRAFDRASNAGECLMFMVLDEYDA